MAEDRLPQSAPSLLPKPAPKKPSPLEPLRWPPEQMAALETFRNRAVAALKSLPPRQADAMEQATKLVGSWPHAQGDAGAATAYLGAIATALREYPENIARECCDPSIGLAREREMMPTVFAVHDWCRGRIKLYRNVVKPHLAAG